MMFLFTWKDPKCLHLSYIPSALPRRLSGLVQISAASKPCREQNQSLGHLQRSPGCQDGDSVWVSQGLIPAACVDASGITLGPSCCLGHFFAYKDACRTVFFSSLLLPFSLSPFSHSFHLSHPSAVTASPSPNLMYCPRAIVPATRANPGHLHPQRQKKGARNCSSMPAHPRGHHSLYGAMCSDSFVLWSVSRLGFFSPDSRGCPGPENPAL